MSNCMARNGTRRPRAGGGRLLITILALVLLAGCQSPEPARTYEGPPPAGYETWEDYYRAEDAKVRPVVR